MDKQWAVLTGQDKSVLRPVTADAPLMLHVDVLPHWQALVAAARAAGFGLAIASAWRGFDRQLAIWNGKASGDRTVLDAAGLPLDIARLTPDELLFAILRWSAIPGCSRHHWGTDLDIYDRDAVPDGYCVQLVPDECTGCGPFAPMHAWLDNQLQRPDAVFYRPYAADCGGIAPEPWHLSCRPVADRFAALLDEERMLDWLMQQDIALKDRIRVHWHEIFHRFVRLQ